MAEIGRQLIELVVQEMYVTFYGDVLQKILYDNLIIV